MKTKIEITNYSVTFGVALAIVISWSLHKSLLWAYPALVVNKDDKEEIYDIQTKLPTKMVKK
jgi:hypothetical protein